MQSEAYKITGFTAVMGAMGFMIRWLQGMKIYDPETGLADALAPINFWVVGVCLLAAAGLLLFVLYLRRFVAPESFKALDGRSLIHPIVGALCGVVLIVGGGSMLFSAGDYQVPILRRILGLMTMAAGVGAIELTFDAGKTEKLSQRRFFSVIMVLCGCMWLVVEYKENSANPVIWSFAPEVLGLCCATLACYYTAGYQFGEVKPRTTIFFCDLGAFFCAMCVIDKNTAADAIVYGALAVLLGLWGFVLVENLEKPGKTMIQQ